ncbi:MAG: ATP-binding protein [Candidatus Aenigmatarchaeota archaeon]
MNVNPMIKKFVDVITNIKRTNLNEQLFPKYIMIVLNHQNRVIDEKEINSYKKRVFSTIKNFKLVEKGDKIFVAVSGGKDSTAALILLKEYIEENNINAEIYAYHINLGFGYSNKLQEDVEKIADKVGVKLFVTNVKEEYGIDIVKASKILKRPICSICGLVKRYLMNKVPRELGATKLATGHHAMDFLINYFKNILNNNYEWNLKILPKLKSEHPKLLTKIRPLIFTFPEENKMYCEYKEVPITSISCPYSPNFCCYLTKSQDSKLFELLNFSDRIMKDFRLNFIKSIVRMNKKLTKEQNSKEKYKECKICGEVTNLDICAFCKIRNLFSNQ